MRITSLTINDVSILRGIARDTFIETFLEANNAEDMDRYIAVLRRSARPGAQQP